MNDLIFKQALKNAYDHEGKASAGAVINRVVGEKPELKSDMGSLGKSVKAVVEQVNMMGKEEIEKQLRTLWPESFEKRDEERHDLPDLENAVKGKVVMRMAPNPSAPPHIGHCRQVLLNWFYCKKYDGKFILRYDDTDPKTPNKKPMKEAYAWWLEDMAWLGVKPDEILYASDHLDTYYEYAEKLINMGKAYVCTCDNEAFKALKEKAEACPCRDLPPEEHLKRWKKMLDWEYKERKAVYRVKTDIKHANPALRDWPGFRIVDNPEHPRVKDKHVWPLLNFNSAIEDHLTGVTHIIRGRDLDATEHQQRFIYEYFGWTYPTVELSGMLEVEGVEVSHKSEILKGIAEGKYIGFDDPKLTTLRGLKNAGFKPEGIKQLIWDLSLRKNNVLITEANLRAALLKGEKNPTFKG